MPVCVLGKCAYDNTYSRSLALSTCVTLLSATLSRSLLLRTDCGKVNSCRAFITETLIPPKDEEDTEEGNDKSDFRDFVSNWLDRIRGNSSELEKVGACPYFPKRVARSNRPSSLM